MAHVVSSSLIPTCPPIPRVTLLGMSFTAILIFACELALLVATLRSSLQGGAVRALRIGVVMAIVTVTILTLGMLIFMVFLGLQSNRFLLPPCQIFIGDTAAQHDLDVFHELEAIVAAAPVVGALVTIGAILLAWLMRYRCAT